MDNSPQVVIIGGGFGGLYAARALRRAPVQLTLVDRRNFHLFQPLLYQVAAAVLSPGDIAAPIRGILRKQENAHVVLGEAKSIDVAGRQVHLEDTTLNYDYLIVATGATHSYFNHPEWERLAPGLKTVEDALDIRRRILIAYEAAERERDPARQREWLTFVIVGAGPTGVELAGALAEISRKTLQRDFRSIDPARSRIVLAEGLPRVLQAYPSELSHKAREQLVRIGVEVRTEAQVTDIDGRGVSLGDERIAARTVLWAAGVDASPLGRSLGARLDRAGRVEIEPTLNIHGHPEVFVIGDLAKLLENGKPVPGVAPAAIQEGEHAAGNIVRLVEGRPPLPFRYHDRGSLATIGRASGVADFGRIRLAGFAAWVAWLTIHLFFLIGFRNRLLVLFEWAWSYFTFQRGARLITGPESRLLLSEHASTP